MTLSNESKLDSASSAHHLETAWGTTMILDIRDHLDSARIADSVLTSLAKADRSEVLSLSEQLFLRTDGAFDPFGGSSAADTTFSPAGLVQAWEVGRASEMLKAEGCENYCITSGGHIVMAGQRSADKPWRLGIRNPLDPSSLTTAVAAAKDGLSVATSNPFPGGGEAAHSPAAKHHSELTGVTVVGPDITTAHAFATALFVKGLEGLNWITRFEGYDAHVITQHNAAHSTPGFKRHQTAG